MIHPPSNAPSALVSPQPKLILSWAVDKSDRRTAAEETADRSRAPHVWVFADEISAVSRGADEAVAADIEPAAELAVTGTGASEKDAESDGGAAAVAACAPSGVATAPDDGSSSSDNDE